MKAALSILAGLALAACTAEPAPDGAQSTDPVENAAGAASDASAKAMKVSLSISGMT
ncbi:MAG: hypothetical protein VX460_04365 [Planctomycetota bacterium]|nr:hypothetical protein [Planctomycetota bacterium]